MSEAYIFAEVWKTVYNETGDWIAANDAASAAVKRYSVDATRYK